MKNQFNPSGFKSEMTSLQHQISSITSQQQQQQQMEDQHQQNIMQAVSMGQVT
jgi:hypothetical protein